MKRVLFVVSVLFIAIYASADSITWVNDGGNGWDDGDEVGQADMDEIKLSVDDNATDIAAVESIVADGDKGDITVGTSGTVWSLDNDVVAAAEMADADHGDISWSGGVASIDANAVALGTDTTGNYAGSSSEGGAATTATALAANGSNCSAGSFPLGVDASGASESCTALPTFTTSTSAASGSCTTGDLWLKTSATVTLYACTATDTWSTGVGI